MIDELESAEELLKEAFIPFLTSLFVKFHEKKFIWDATVSMLSELDCLVSLSIASG